MSDRFTMPVPGIATPVRFPDVVTEILANGLSIRVIPQATVPAFTAMLVVRRGTSSDPASKPGLASLTGDLIDEGAGTRDAIELADAFARIGAHCDIDVNPDATSVSVSGIARHLDRALGLVADIVMRPRLTDPDFARVRDLRLGRLRQLSRSTGAIADRVFVSSVFGDHPYGHGSLGTTASLEQVAIEDARAFWASTYQPRASTLIVGGTVDAADVMRAATTAFGGWVDAGDQPPITTFPVAATVSQILLVDRPGSPQSDLRIGHIGPSRGTAAYHSLITLNALLGGQFTSRINRRLREEKGITYGARTSFDFRRVSGSFSCDTSVQADATAIAVADVLSECEDIRRDGAVSLDELRHAQASLTRGYVRHFETGAQLARAAAQLVTFELPPDTFDRFVPGVEAVTPDDVLQAARQFVHPSRATIVVVGDRTICEAPLQALGRPVTITTPEF